jgi:hypothetical protein
MSREVILNATIRIGLNRWFTAIKRFCCFTLKSFCSIFWTEQGEMINRSPSKSTNRVITYFFVLWFFASILVKRCGLKHSISTLCKFKQYYFIRICFNAALTISYGKRSFRYIKRAEIKYPPVNKSGRAFFLYHCQFFKSAMVWVGLSALNI